MVAMIAYSACWFCYVISGPGACGGTSYIYVMSEGALVIPQPVEQGRILPNALLSQPKKDEKLKACQSQLDSHTFQYCFVMKLKGNTNGLTIGCTGSWGFGTFINLMPDFAYIHFIFCSY